MIDLFPAQVRAWEWWIYLSYVTPLIFCFGNHHLCYFCVSATDTDSSYGGDIKSNIVTPIICEDEETKKAVQADPSFTVSTDKSTESTGPQLNPQPEGSTTSAKQPPSSPVMDLETDFPSGEISYNVISTPSLLKRCSCHNLKVDRLAMEKTQSHSQVFCVCFCRIVGSEAICSTARSEEA